MRTFKPLFRNKKFVRLWISQFVSQIAVNTLNFLVILIIFKETGSTIATSLVWLAFIVPAITIAPIASAMVDYYDKRKIMVIANLAQAGVVFGYGLIQNRFVFMSYGVVLLYSFFNQFYIPAEVSTLSLIVKKKYLSHANSLFLATYQLGLVIGFGLAGVVGDLIGFDTAFIFASLLLFIAFVATYLLPPIPSKLKTEPDFLKNIELFYNGIVEGFDFIRKQRNIYLPFAAIIGMQVLLSIVVISMPAIAISMLKVNPNYSGIIMAGPAGGGAVIGAILISRMLEAGWSKRRIVEIGLYGLNLTIWPLILLVPYLPDTIRILVAVFLFLLIGMSFIAIYITSQTMLQTNTPPRFLGRVFGNAWFFTTVATVFPMMFSATVTEITGPRTMFGLLSIGILGGLYYYNKHVKQLAI
jgi:DHA3 family macrolide efflux protein-like MFS transporter